VAVIARCHEVKQIADSVLENLHRLSVDLRPPALDHLGLEAALRQHTEMVSDQHRLPIQFVTIGKIERLAGDVETAVYRIVQEALTNVVRHANATRVDILLERRGDVLIVVVEDNGIGMDLQELTKGQLGVVGMYERAEMLGGKVTVESAPGKGTTVFLEVPCPFES
jgi:signal transduction histidine kinase